MSSYPRLPQRNFPHQPSAGATLAPAEHLCTPTRPPAAGGAAMPRPVNYPRLPLRRPWQQPANATTAVPAQVSGADTTSASVTTNPADQTAGHRQPEPCSPGLGIGSSPLGWWRTLPADRFRAADHLAISSALAEIAVVLEGSRPEPALSGDPKAAIALVLSILPISEVTLMAEIAMTAVLRCAFEGDLGAALVLAHVLDRADRDRPWSGELSASWFKLYLRRSQAQGRLTAAEQALIKELRARDCAGADAGRSAT